MCRVFMPRRGDLYQAVKDLDEYNFKPERGFSIGLKYAYPIFLYQFPQSGVVRISTFMIC